VEIDMAIPNAERQRAYRQRAAAALRAQTSTLAVVTAGYAIAEGTFTA
jgi:hypothetical protein